MKKVRFLLSMILIIAVAFGIVNSPAAADEAPIKIAVAAPLTGDNSEYGIGFYNAVTMMAESWNEKGGIQGRSIVVEQFDDKNSPEEGVSC